MNRNLNLQKNEEEYVIEKFKKVLNFKILNLNDAKKLYSGYTGENPDFIIHYESDYIGIELFRLCLEKSDVPIQHGDGQYKNLMQMQSLSGYFNELTLEQAQEDLIRRKNSPSLYPLIPSDDFVEILKEMLSKKIAASEQYVSSKCWLLGYVHEGCNDKILGNIYQDKMEKDIKLLIRSIVDGCSKIRKVILFEPYSLQSKILEVNCF